MTYVPGYAHDVFVSYAHFDNEADSQEIRWVSRFQADLKNALRQRLGEDPEIFYDTRNFAAHEHVDALLESARRSAIFLAVFSPSYVAREFTIGELKAFRVLVIDSHPVIPADRVTRAALDRLAVNISKAGCAVARTSPLVPDLAAMATTYTELLVSIFTADIPAEACRRA